MRFLPNTDERPPQSLSGLILLSINDLKSLDRNKYYPDGGSWHGGLVTPGRCGVCLAGGVIAHSIGVDREAYYSPENLLDGIDNPSDEELKWSEDWEKALWALEYVRTCHLDYAIKNMEIKVSKEQKMQLDMLSAAMRIELFGTPRPGTRFVERPLCHMADWTDTDRFLSKLGEVVHGLKAIGL